MRIAAQHQRRTKREKERAAQIKAEAIARRPDIPTLLEFLKGAWSEVLHPAEELSVPWCVELIAEHLTAISIAGLVQVSKAALSRKKVLEAMGEAGELTPEELEDQTAAQLRKSFEAIALAEKLCEPYDCTLDRAIAKAQKKLLVNLPPRFTKSTLISVVWPCWEWLCMPWVPWMCLSYDSGLANDHNDDRRKIVVSDWYQSLAGEMPLSRSKNRLSEFENSDRGIMLSRGLNCGVTGHGSVRQIYDDPNDPMNVEAAVRREVTLKRYRDYSTTRRNMPLMAATVVVQQRTHYEDVSGWIIKNAPGYHHICLPMEAEVDELHIYPLSGKVVRRKPGDILDPERFPPSIITELKENSFIWAGRYQQRPAPLEGGMIKKEYVRRYGALPANPDKIVFSLDSAAKDKDHNDPWAWQIWYVKDNLFYLAYAHVARCEYPEGDRITRSLMLKWQPTHSLIEDKSTGQVLIPVLRADAKFRRFNVIDMMPCKDKVTRMETELGALQAGRVYLPEMADWLADYETVAYSFPNSPIRDPIDSTSQFLRWMREHGSVVRAGAESGGNIDRSPFNAPDARTVKF